MSARWWTSRFQFSNYPQMRIPLWELGNPARGPSTLMKQKNPRVDTLKRGRIVSPYPCYRSPKIAQLSAKKEPFSPQSLPQGKWVQASTRLHRAWRMLPRSLTFVSLHQSWGNQHSWTGFQRWHTDLKSYWLACGHQKGWRKRRKRVDYLYAIKVQLFPA